MKKLQHPQVIIPTLEIIHIEQNDIKKYLGKIKLNKIKVAFFGSDIFVIPVLQALEDNFEVSAVVTAPNSAVANYFKGPIFTSGKLDENFKSQISNFKSDLFIVASFGKIIPKDILEIPKYSALNVHPSLLPKYRGASPIQSTILNGDKISGITIIKMDKEMDHGPIIYTEQFRLSKQDTFDSLSKKMFLRASEVLPKIIKDFIMGKIKLKVQDHARATYCTLIRKEDGYFDLPAGRQVSPEFLQKLDRMIRAYYPWPGVWTKWSFDSAQDHRNGKIVKFLPNQILQMEGKRVISFKDFLNGYPDFPLKDL